MTRPTLVRIFKRFWPIFVILAAALLAMLSMFRGREFVWGIDSTWPLHLREISRYSKLFDGTLGSPDVRKLPFLAPFGAVLILWRTFRLPYDPSLIQHLMVWGMLACSGLSSYLLIRTFFPSVNRVARLGGAVFYMFNLYAITTIWTPLSNLVFHYCLFPLVFVLWHEAFLRRSVLFAVLAAAAWTLTVTPAYTTTPTAILDLLLLGSLFCLHFIRGKRMRLRLLTTGGALVGTWLVLNVFWLYPLKMYLPAETARGLAQGNPLDLFRLNSAPLIKAIRLGGYWGLDASYKGSEYLPWGTYYRGWSAWLGYIVPVLALIALAAVELKAKFFSRGAPCPNCGTISHRSTAKCFECSFELPGLVTGQERGHVHYFVILLLIALVLVSGTFWPFGPLKDWLFSSAPLASFRSVYQRFMVYVVLAYCPLVSLGLHALASAMRRSKFGRSGGSLVSTALTLGLAYMFSVLAVYPLWTSAYTARSGIIPSRRTNIPRVYFNDANWLSDQTGDFNVLVFPSGPGLETSLDWGGGQGLTGIEPLTLMMDRSLVYQDPAAPYLKDLIKMVSVGGAGGSSATLLLNARFIVVHLDANENFLRGRDDFIGVDPNVLRTRFSRAPGLRLVRHSKYLLVYQVLSWLPARLLAIRGYTGVPLAAMRGENIRPLPYRVLAPGRYDFRSDDIHPGEIAVLNSPFDSHWSADGGTRLWVAPGLTGFGDLSQGGRIIVDNSARESSSRALVSLPLAIVVLLTSLVIVRRRSPGNLQSSLTMESEGSYA